MKRPQRPPRQLRNPKPKPPRSYRGMPSSELIRAIREDFGQKTMLSFSRGKDSLGCWIALREVFEAQEIVPYYCYAIPGLLSFERESLEYFEHVFGRKIHVLPHPGLYRWLNDLVHQPPIRIAPIQAADLPQFEYDIIHQIVSDRENVPSQALVASGVRSADSAVRRMAISKHGPVSLSVRQYYPIYDWNKERLISEIKRSGIKLPEDYHLFGRTWDGLDIRFIVPLMKYKPADYQKILEWFPMVEMQMWLLKKRGII